MRERVKQQVKIQKNQPQFEEDYYDEAYLPERKMRRKKKKKPKKKVKEPEVDIRDLLMVQAYGGMTQTQVDKLIAERKKKEMSQM